MSQVSRSPILWKTSCLFSVALSLMLSIALPAAAQLTEKDIAVMQQRIAEEGLGFEVGLNDATQYPLEQLCGLKEPPNWRDSARFVEFSAKGPIPPSFDWRTRTAGGMPPIRNQGGCGSCWAFAAMGALECAIKIQDGHDVDLSEQWLVSCNRHGWGCDGGWWAHDYLCYIGDQCDSIGAVLEQDYPYTATDAPCSCSDPHPYRIETWGYIGAAQGVPIVPAIKLAIMQHGPVTVSVAVDNYFQAYRGGVFTICTAAEINHAVVIVGWDDNLGASGAWIMRNSWGPNWGDSGYMYIAYGCDMIGYAASFMEYDGGVALSADVQSGWAPLDVNFDAQSGLNLINWSWNFGDGATASGQAATHTYTQAGTYTVVASGIDSLGQVRSREKINYISALADTVRTVHTGAVCGTRLEVPVSVRNSAPVRYMRLPIDYNGPVDLLLDSFSTAGCRTDYFQKVSAVHADLIGKRLTLQLISSELQTAPYLEPGEGPVVRLFFTVPDQDHHGEVTTIDVDGYLSYTPLLSWPLLEWTPKTLNGSVTLAINRGDCDGSSGITVSDLTFLVNYLFRGGASPVPALSADSDCSMSVNINDVTYLVNYMFKGGPDPASCF